MANMAPLTKRLVKGSPLTSQEGDNNWSIIEAYVNALSELLAVSLNDDGSLIRPLVVRGASTNGSQDYAATIEGTYATAADLVGLIIVLHVDTASNPTASNDFPTLTLNGTIGPLNIKKLVNVLPASGDIRVNQECVLTYDPVGSSLILHNPASSPRGNFAPSALVALAANDYTITLPDLSTYTFEIPQAYYAGYRIGFIAPTSLTSVSPEPTLKVAVTSPSITTFAAKTIKKLVDTGKVALRVGDITANSTYEVVYDGTDFVLLNPNADPCIYRSLQRLIPATGGPIAAMTAEPHGLGGKPDIIQVKYYCVGTNALTGSYAPGDEIPASAVNPRNAGATVAPIAVILDTAGLTYTVVKSVWTDVVMSVKATGAVLVVSQANFIVDFEIQVVLTRYRR